jgi:hypothetical protein
MPRSTKPLGQLTRGKTASNRLRRVDNFILLYEPSLLTRTASTFTSTGSAQRLSPGSDLFADSMFVDLGYGFDPRTTLESAERFRRVNPDLKILGVEIDKERVEAALPYADEKTFFRLGGFNLPLQPGENVRLVRAFNVLRQYEEKDFIPAYETLARYVLPGGLMIEGTSNPFGSIWCANVARRRDVTLREPIGDRRVSALESKKSFASLRMTDQWEIEALVFSTNFRLGFEPDEFQTVLPKNLIHRVVPGEPIHDFFEAWKRSSIETVSARTYGVRQWFIATAERMAERGYEVRLQRKWLSKGYLIWNISG